MPNVPVGIKETKKNKKILIIREVEFEVLKKSEFRIKECKDEL